MFANNYISTIVENQLPDFVRADHPNFVLLLKKYYEYLEQTDKSVYTNKRLYDYFDVDSTRADLIQYFKTKIIPNFPEITELSTEKLIKFAKYFYSKKGTPESLKFLFRVLYGQEIELYYPKQDILRASDGKWKLPQALRISLVDTSTLVPGGTVSVANISANLVVANGINLVSSGITANSYILLGTEKRKVNTVASNGNILYVDIPFANTGSTLLYDESKLYKLILNEYENFDFNLLERRKGVGEVSRTTCVIESAIKTVDKSTGREIAELYVSNVQRPFETNENILITYTDPNTNEDKIFSAKIISLISNISISRKRTGERLSGRRYRTGDPVVFYGGLNQDSTDAIEAVATVGNVTVGSIDTISLVKSGYFFRDYPNSIVQINSATGVGANIIVQAIWEDAGNSESFTFNTDAILPKYQLQLNDSDFQFDAGPIDINSQIGSALSSTTATLGKIRLVNLVKKGFNFESDPELNIISVVDTDYSEDVGLTVVPTGQFGNYSISTPSIELNAANSSYSNANAFYTGTRLFLDTGDNRHYVNVVDYIVTDVNLPTMKKTLYLNKPFESNINEFNINTLNLYIDFRVDVRLAGKLGAIEVVNGGSGYSATNDVLEFLGTGYGAAATLSIAGGSITGVTITDRGTGYYTAPTYRIVNTVSGLVSTGTGAEFNIYTLSDGEQINTQVGDLGAIQNIQILNRGFDYNETPNVSLKIVDILTNNLPTNTIILEGDKVWQGNSFNDSTFKGTVDKIYRNGVKTVIRVYDYNGTLSTSSNLSVNTSTQNLTVNILNSVENVSYDGVTPVDDRPYPKFYGDGLAKANVEFLNGLIRYDGFYLNTDGFISWDKKIQNNNYFHNYSYEIQSEKTLNDYKDTIYSIGHPAGLHLLSKHIIKDKLNETIRFTSNVHTTNDAPGGTINTSFTVLRIIGNGTDFANTANVGDFIVINTSDPSEFRIFTKEITSINPLAQELFIDSIVDIIGDGRLQVTSGDSELKVFGNIKPLNLTVQAPDQIRLNVNGTLYTRTVDGVTSNSIIVNSSIPSSGNNILYDIRPFLRNKNYKIINLNG